MRYAGVMQNDFTDGVGVSVSFWVQGCPHHCEGCCNRHTWDFNSGLELPDDYVDRVISLLHKNGVSRNLSILGGEPLCPDNAGIVLNLVQKTREIEGWGKFKIFIWTGYVLEDILSRDDTARQVLNFVDYLIDGLFEIDKRDISLRLKGSTNQRIINVQRSLQAGQCIVETELETSRH